jgi:hypothetical protein
MLQPAGRIVKNPVAVTSDLLQFNSQAPRHVPRCLTRTDASPSVVVAIRRPRACCVAGEPPEKIDGGKPPRILLPRELAPLRRGSEDEACALRQTQSARELRPVVWYAAKREHRSDRKTREVIHCEHARDPRWRRPSSLATGRQALTSTNRSHARPASGYCYTASSRATHAISSSRTASVFVLPDCTRRDSACR